MPVTLDPSQAMSSTLDSIHITPRTPRTASKLPRNGQAYVEDDIDEVQMSLLGEEERREAAADLQDEEVPGHEQRALSTKDKRGIVLLIVLYLIQGVPLGLALGSVPFLLREHLSYSQLAVFALSSYPYSLKLLWSPFVDSKYFPSVGRRKSWIIPMQAIIGTLMLYISYNVQALLDSPADNVYMLTAVFTSLVLFSATQDIAVDGWALTLLSQENISYASTCQTIGLNSGYFASFTVFLALNSQNFSDKWGIPRLELATYLRFWTVICYCVTIWLLFFKKEDPESHSDEPMSIKVVYKNIWGICKLSNIQTMLIVHLLAKIGFQANEAVTRLKMVEKGLGREDLAIAVLIDFPFQILGGWLAARLCTPQKPLRPWIWAYWPRLGFALSSTLIVYWFPKPPVGYGFFVFLVVHTVAQSFCETLQFAGISAFHTRISDPLIGGTYMTLLNTFSNLGGTWPRFFVLKGVDFFTVATCKVKEAGTELTLKTAECVSDAGKAHCADINGECVTEHDGYYYVSAICLVLGAISIGFYIIPTARRLQSLPPARWRVSAA
ncbi:MFS general substrate transporter [Punctularia strigosozonata HHB-11173 SS5]|uniref:MFS general substrate transporter n=1 Tax=Punctularia strigosozonata (strain HHB-11173) TaxID=741275 RepID=UPI000441832F|nr:MFS general substrate transporter [Punctularia strigosozonata HHB-11173 SS5]EIN13244.1 MFS general substrate transporter [Punctularia strigosozonata HHB-11173 SS5]